jgi:dihydroorotase
LTAALEGKISLERVVDACSTAPARIFGLTKKGDIAVGRDADIVLVDLNREYEISDGDVLSLTGWSPYAGRKVRGKPVHTMVRGRTVYLNGEVIGEKGWGKQARAQVSAAIA